MRSFSRVLATSVALSAVAAMPALAHPGNHHGMSLSELAAHLGQGWHALLLAAPAVTGLLAVALWLRQRRAADQRSRTTRQRT
ncbi:MAG: hypothetical protein AB7O57_15660 [Hyphomicrobiaceae bacterium]